MITGDDLLIEYTYRLMRILKLLREDDIDIEHKMAIESFIKHSAWISTDLKDTVPNSFYWQRLETRMFEMKDRKKRLARTIAKKEGYTKDFEKQYEKLMNTK